MAEIENSPIDTLNAVIGLVTRRRWYILSIATVTALATVAILYQLPNRYTSEATLFVVQQQVPTRYVTPTNTTELAEALPAMAQEVLSRNRLLELVEQFDLYAPQRQRLAPEEVVALIRKNIAIEPLPPEPGQRESEAFKISFSAPKAILAQQVTSKLTSLFIEGNLKTREDQARNTTNFLHGQLEAARQKLSQQEDLLRDFKTKYLGELPEQQQGNLAILSGAQLQLQNISASLDRAQQQHVYIESLLNGYRRVASRGGGVPGVSGPETTRPVSPYQAAQAELARLQTERSKLLVNYGPRYPDIIAIEREIAIRQALVRSLIPQANDTTEPTQTKSVEIPQLSPSAGTMDSEEDTSIAQLKSQLESNRVEIANLTRDQTQEKAVITEYQSRLNLAPVREQQLAGILRDYELSKQDYADLLGKEQQSQLAMSLEKQQGGQQFRVVEPPSLPELPSSPKRLKISLGGVGAGLFLGLAAAFLVELKNQAFYTERQVSQRFSIPLVVGLPLLLDPGDKRRRTWIRVLDWLGGAVLITAVVIAEAWVYRHPQ